MADPKFFLFKLTFRGERAPKKRDFLVKIFQKVSKKAIVGPFFQKFKIPPQKNPRSAPAASRQFLSNQV